jgi:TRAP-type C4-dicarboxylate transport system permease small subunit
MTSVDTTKRTPVGVRILDGLQEVVNWAAGLALLCVTLTIFFNATGRYLTGWSFLGGEELARLLTVWITFVGAFVLVRQEKHVNIDLILGASAPKVQRIMRGLSGAIGMLVMSYLAWTSYQLSAFSFGTGQIGTTLPVPRGLFFLPVFVGAVLMLIAFTEIFVRAILNKLKPLEVMGGGPGNPEAEDD